MHTNFKWHDRYLIGIPEIDEEHREIFRRAEQLVRKLGETDRLQTSERHRKFLVEEGLHYLRKCMISHFIHEEEYIKYIDYPKYLWHKNLHNEFRCFISPRCDALLEKEYVTTSEVLDLGDLVLGWIHAHILTADKQLADLDKFRIFMQEHFYHSVCLTT